MYIAVAMALNLATQETQLPERLLSSVCWVESKHNPNAIHHDDGYGDSVGLCQIKEETAKQMGMKSKEDLKDPYVNAKYAALYLKKQLNRYPNNIKCAIAAYNAGVCRLNQQGKIKNRNYVEKVFNVWSDW